jgi:hypothetical protein
MGTEAGSSQARSIKLFALADDLGLTRDERIEFARTILHRDIVSYRQLSPDQVNRMLDAFEGALLFQELKRQRVTLQEV